MEDIDQRVVAIKKLQIVRQFAAQDKEPCEVLPGLFIGESPRRSFVQCRYGGEAYALNLLRACFIDTDLACFVGPIGAARNLESLQKCGISHVLNASPVIPCFHKRHLRYKKVLVYDDPDDDISRYFDESSRFIHKV